MMILAIDWGFAMLVTGMGIGVVFLMLVILIGVIGFQSKIINKITTDKTKQAAQPEQSESKNTTETHPTPHEQAAIAMAMHLYFNAHDEEPHVITIQQVERRYSPWSSKIYSMRSIFNR